MTESNPAQFLSTESHSSASLRRLFATLFHDAQGVVLAGDLQVTEKGTGANMSVDVAGGRAVILGSQSTYQGSYFVENEGIANRSITAADATNPRVDVVVARVEDSVYSGTENRWIIQVVQGTPAPTPAVPAIPVNSLKLAQVSVPAQASAIVNGSITDFRTLVHAGSIQQYMIGSVSGASVTGTVPNATTAVTAGKWTNQRTLTFNGDMTGQVTLDGSVNKTVTLNADLEAADIPTIAPSKVSGGGSFGTGHYTFPTTMQTNGVFFPGGGIVGGAGQWINSADQDWAVKVGNRAGAINTDNRTPFAIIFDSAHGTGAAVGMSVMYDEPSNGQNKTFIKFQFATGVDGGSIISNGTTVAFAQPSDVRYKENIEQYEEGAVSILNEIDTIKYNIKGQPARRLGFSAQQLLTTDLAHLVSEMERKEGEDVDRLQVSETELIPYLVVAIKELSEEVNRLKENNRG